jgi:hypothetical protein
VADVSTKYPQNVLGKIQRIYIYKKMFLTRYTGSPIMKMKININKEDLMYAVEGWNRPPLVTG